MSNFLVFSILYTGGCDCLVRIWKADAGTDQEPSAAIEANQPVTCVAAAVSLRVFSFVEYHTHNYPGGRLAIRERRL